jgi:2-methylcitrate dehydratase PrpD
MLFGVPTKHEQVDTFEKMLAYMRQVMPERYEEAKYRFLDAFTRSAGANDYDVVEVERSSVWGST